MPASAATGVEASRTMAVTLTTLPPEVLDNVGLHLPDGSGLNLALTCRALVDVGLRALYSSTTIRDGHAWRLFCDAVAARSSIASHVGHLIFAGQPPDPPRVGDPFPVLLACRRLFVGGSSVGEAWLAIVTVGTDLFEDEGLDLLAALRFAEDVCPLVEVVWAAHAAPASSRQGGRPSHVLPRLEQVRILVDEEPIRPSLALAGCGSTLRRLEVIGSGYLSNSNDGCEDEYGALARLFPNLEYLKISPSAGVHHDSSESVEFPALRYLETMGNDFALNVFAHRYPSLVTLQLVIIDYDEPFSSDTGRRLVRTLPDATDPSVLPRLETFVVLAISHGPSHSFDLRPIRDWANDRGVEFIGEYWPPLAGRVRPDSDNAEVDVAQAMGPALTGEVAS